MASVSKVKVEENGSEMFQVISNPGLVTAINSVYEGGAPEPGKTDSVTSIVGAAYNGQSLKNTDMRSGEQFFGIDVKSNCATLATYSMSEGSADGVVKGIKLGPT